MILRRSLLFGLIFILLTISYGFISVPAGQTAPQSYSAEYDFAPQRRTPTPTVIPHLNSILGPYTIEGLRARTYPGGEIEIVQAVEGLDRFTRYVIQYPSDGLTIQASMHVPVGIGPFPVIILNHGYVRRSEYFPGAGTYAAADYFAEHGYVTIAPDYRSWGDSDTGLSIFHAGLVTDVMNLLSSLHTLEFVDPNRVGMWGHSMGGGVTTKILTIEDDRVKAAVLYASNSSNDAELIDEYGVACIPGRRQRPCNAGEVIPQNLPEEVLDAYLAATEDSEILYYVAPYNYLDYITTPIQIHIGTADDTTPPWWSVSLHQALQEAGKTVDFFSYEGQGHLFVGDDWETFLLRNLLFFDSYLR